METFKYETSEMNEQLDWLCAEIEKIKEFQVVVESKFTKLELRNTTPAQPIELNISNKADMAPRQPEEMYTTNKRVATSSQRQQCDLMGVGNKGDCFLFLIVFVFDLFKNRISQLEKEISKKEEIISFLTEQISVKNVLTIPLQNEGPEKRGANNNSLNDSIESEVPREEAHTIKLNKKKKVVVAGDSLLNGISEKGLSRDHQVTVKNLPGGTTKKVLEEIEDLVADTPDCIIIHAGTNDITNGMNSLNSVKKIVKDVKKSSPNTKLVFFSILIRKDKKGISKKVTDINSRLKKKKHLLSAETSRFHRQ